jgi:iron complex outermembrane receptor protein
MTEGDLPGSYAGGAIARGGRLGLLGNKGVMDTPFSVSHYTSKRMADAQAASVADVLARDASVRFTGQAGGVTDSFYIRGFPINEGNVSDIAFDGVYGVAPNYHQFPEYLERVEILKGPGALLFGMSPNSAVGGVVNLVPKRPLAVDLTRVTVDYTSAAQGGAAVDMSRRFGSDRQFGFRFNGLHRQGSTPLDKQSARAEVGALSLDYQGEKFRASLNLIEQYQWVDATTRPFLVSKGLQVPAAPDGARNVVQSWSWWKSFDQSALLHAEYDVSPNMTVFADAGTNKSVVARLSDQTPTILNAAGDTISTPWNARFKIDRSTFNMGTRLHADTGAVSHAIALQANLYQDRVAQASVSGTPVRSNIVAPVESPAQAIREPSVPKISSSRLSGIALADTLAMLDDRLQLIVGLRAQQISSDNFSATTGATTSSYDKSAITPLAAIVVKPLPNVSLYANYVEGLSKGDIAPDIASNAGQVFAPYKTKQQEVGVKVDMNRFLATLALFRITKPSGQLSNSNLFSVDSEQRNQGLELSLSGELIKGVRLLGGVTLLNATLTKTPNRATLGNRPIGAPDWLANAGLEWDVPGLFGTTLTGGVNFTGREYIDQANTQSVPSWTTIDLGARYATKVYGKPTTIRAGLLNAFDRRYWAGVASFGTISAGAPRTVFVSASMDF